METNLPSLQKNIEHLFEHREGLRDPAAKEAIREAIHLLDLGKIRVASPGPSGWTTNEWVKKAILLYFAIQELEHVHSGAFEYYDKIPLKALSSMPYVRSVPGSVVRAGAHLEPKVVLMPSFVNIGAYVGAETMVDTWATVGSCAQVGSRVHLSGGVGIGGVLEPPQASPVIIEDGVFVGSRAIVVEGVKVEAGAVLGANVVLTASTKIIDVSGSSEKVYQGVVPARSVVIPGTRSKKFPAGEYGVPVALIIGQRKASTDEKTSLNDALRDFEVPV